MILTFEVIDELNLNKSFARALLLISALWPERPRQGRFNNFGLLARRSSGALAFKSIKVFWAVELVRPWPGPFC